jgi:dephospho-CoA kinase
MTNFKARGKIVIGLTGGISAGKSVAAAAFRKAGAFVICADALAAEHLALQLPAVQKYFGTADKKKIAAQVFKSAAKRKWLERRLHPLIIKDAAATLKKSSAKVIVFDVPLLFEAGLQNSFDLVLCIYADTEVRRKRAALSRFAAGDFDARDDAQMPLMQKAQKADIVIFNNGAKRDLAVKISKFYRSLKGATEESIWTIKKPKP